MLLVNHSREQFLSIVSKISVTTLSIKQQIQGLQALASGTPYLKKTVIYYMYQLYTVVCYFLCDTKFLLRISIIRHTCSICEKR